MKAVSIKNKVLETPIIQGGMGIGVSRCGLAGAVAKEGGMGVVSTAQIGYDAPDFRSHPEEANLCVLPGQIRKAKEMAEGHGMIGVNIMAVTQRYGEYVQTACEAGVDAIISGAGLPTELPKFAEGYDAALAPIVSSAKSAKVILKYWDRKYKRTADFLVIEGPKAGGHLGFSREELEDGGPWDYDTEIHKILEEKRKFEEKYQTAIPVFVAGGIFDAEDVQHALELGADGVQVASRFVATRECDASDAYKRAYVEARTEDVVIIDSPVGMPGRALKNAFIEEITGKSQKISHCFHCLKACNPASAHYCITQALINAVKGDLDHGLIFCGSRVGEIGKISTVKAVMQELSREENS
ncbi:MAG: nitronate monooxygenase family protein [Eubacteriales bacterium]|nr:nitronate monooxygenase family protein [Eubacteriales bacterium]